MPFFVAFFFCGGGRKSAIMKMCSYGKAGDDFSRVLGGVGGGV